MHFPVSSHIRHAIAYMALTSLVLIFLNVYSSRITRELLFGAKASQLTDKVQMVTSSFSGMDMLTTDNVSQVISVLGDLNVTRVLVTDGESRVLYDSLSIRSAVGDYALLREITDALTGQDVIHCRYDSGVLESHAAMPVMLHASPIGCVYISDIDEDKGAVIQTLEGTVLRLSLAAEFGMILFSMIFGQTASRKMRKILISMKMARDGEYSHKIKTHGTDEYSRMAREFNKLTDRLEESQLVQRQFVSDASHELKTPLASIKLLSDSILQNEMDADTMREFVSDIGNEADRLTRMAQKLLAMTRAEDVQQEHEVVDLSQTISKVYKMLVPLADTKGIRLTSTMEKDCTVMTVEDDTYQIIFNLVENAIKYNIENGKVHVNLARRDEDVVITVEDTGIGIPEDSIPHIFERFYRVDKARSRQAGGSGLGLSIVHGLVERNYGTIAVSRKQDGGSRFVVTFPHFSVEVEQ